MNCTLDQDEQIRKIEDIIDIQKAKGKFSEQQVAFTERQVAFHLPSDSESTKSANLAKSLDSGLSKKPVVRKKKYKKRRLRRRAHQLPDVVSWPSDSDVTVLRMKLCIANDIKETMRVPGDGLHHPDSSSMVNLATLMMQSHSLSKHSLVEEYLIPLTSWAEGLDESDVKKPAIRHCDEEKLASEDFTHDAVIMEQKATQAFLGVKDSGTVSQGGNKSKIARFLRLYFCSCCTCLYKMENYGDKATTYDSINKQHI